VLNPGVAAFEIKTVAHFAVYLVNGIIEFV
jgi:hypothetical protein